jgi:hypothetical protein
MSKKPPDGKTYRLETLADFWALGDADRMERAFKEVARTMAYTKRLEALYGVPVEIEPCITWTDDGGKFFDVSTYCGGNKEFEMKMTLGPGFHD